MTDIGKLERETKFSKAAEALAGEIIYEATDANGVKMGDLEVLLRKRLSVVCGLGKYRALARFQMADDTGLYEIRDNTGRLP